MCEPVPNPDVGGALWGSSIQLGSKAQVREVQFNSHTWPHSTEKN